MFIKNDNSPLGKLATEYGVRFDGLQKTINHGLLPLFTHPEFGTFTVQHSETLADAIERKRIQFSNNGEPNG